MRNEVYESNGLQMRYRIEDVPGSTTKPLLIALHGFGGGPQDYQDVLPELTNKFCVVLPNLKNFFSVTQPTTFRDQVAYLEGWFNQLLKSLDARDVSVIGQSYGATLSVGLRTHAKLPIRRHVIVNPMPFSPFEHIRSPHLRMFMNFGFENGDVGAFLRTPNGRRSLAEVAKIFRIGSFGSVHEIQHLNDRKLILVEKAIERFRWIDKNEQWDDWIAKISSAPDYVGPDLLLYSSRDPLFHGDEIARFGRDIRAQSLSPVAHHGHLLIQDMGLELLRTGRLELLNHGVGLN